MTPPTKQPIIRPGQRVPYYKGSQREIDARRGYVVRLMVRAVPKMAIHDVIKATFNRQWRQTDRDIALVTEVSQWRERVRTGYGRISLYEAFV
jgi:hypothetical protein